MGVSPKIVQAMVTRRDLPAVVLGSRTRIPASAVQAYVDKIELAVELARRMAAEPREDPP
jgi:excisionase family DNA binding protein